MAHVFVSHSSQDRGWVHQCIVDPLRAAGHNPFFSDESILGGADFIKRITDELRKSERFVVVVSPRAANSDWVKTEVEVWFRERRTDNPIPVLMEPGEAYHVHPRLVYCQAIDLSNPVERSHRISMLLASLNEDAARGCPIPLQTEELVEPEHRPRKKQASKLDRAFAGRRAGQTRDENELRTGLVWIPPGEFVMGSPNEEKDRRDDESQVPVILTKGFWLGQHEVTRSEWQRLMKTTPWSFTEYVLESDDYPATYLSWDDAREFCEKLSEYEHVAGRLPSGWRYILPTEAQWEYACRGGTNSRFSFGDDEGNLSQYALFATNGWDVGKKNAPSVAQRRANPWGLFDMHGNAREWCRDWYAPQLAGGADPDGPQEGVYRVHRGGSWCDAAGVCRSASRGKGVQSYRDDDLGFRVAAVRLG